jgi:Lipase
MFSVVKFVSVEILLLVISIRADYNEVRVAFFNSPNSSKFLAFPLDSVVDILTHKDFDANRKTVLYIHGYRQNLASPSLILVIEAFIKRKTHNILALDWSAYSDGNYITNAVPNLIQIGRMLGRAVYFLIINNPMDMKQLHGEEFSISSELNENSLPPVVGHSLGAQLAGYFGSWVIAFSRGTMKIGRITALDPAKPMFYTKLAFLPTHLTYRDAYVRQDKHRESRIFV